MKEPLPVDLYTEAILNTVIANPITIITAPTGSGKSTRVPQILMKAGLRTLVTQPRRLAARAVAEHVAYEANCELGEDVGYRTAYERLDSPNTFCLFCTDGLALVRELVGYRLHDVIILDEVHEWNINMEILLGWLIEELKTSPKLRLVLMSATLKIAELSKFCNNAPVIDVNGRQFPVETAPAQFRTTAEEATRYLKTGHNVLIFEPGKSEISATINTLTDLSVDAEIMALHGEMEPSDQSKSFHSYNRPKCVVATNIAETSITIKDIDVVIDSGMERRIEVVDGIETLCLRPISLANSIQRKGRAGRCKAGIYVDLCPEPNQTRPAYSTPEILRTRLDQAVLRLSAADFQMEDMKLFHQPAIDEIRDAKRLLRQLGCLDHAGQITSMGRKISQLPISVRAGRMIVEAHQRNVIGDILTIAAIIEAGGITKNTKYPAWRSLANPKFVDGDYLSDVPVMLELWRKCQMLSPEKMVEYDILPRSYYRAIEIRQHLAETIQQKVPSLGSSGNREDIVQSVCVGLVDHIYKSDYGRIKADCTGETREIDFSSIVRSGWICGLPFNLEISTRNSGKKTLRKITMVSEINPEWLPTIAPNLTRVEKGIDPRYNEEDDIVYATRKIFFREIEVLSFLSPWLDCPQPQVEELRLRHSLLSDVFDSWTEFEEFYHNYKISWLKMPKSFRNQMIDLKNHGPIIVDQHACEEILAWCTKIRNMVIAVKDHTQPKPIPIDAQAAADSLSAAWGIQKR